MEIDFAASNEYMYGVTGISFKIDLSLGIQKVYNSSLDFSLQ